MARTEAAIRRSDAAARETTAGARPAGTRERALDVVPLAALVVFGIVAVIGYAWFGRDASRLGGLSSWGAWFYGVSYGFFAQGHILLAGVVLCVHLTRRVGARWLWAFVGVYLLSLGSELAGTAYGFPFGPYRYTDLLGPMWLGHVPAVIPLSWFSMAIPSYLLAVRALGGRDEVGRCGWLKRIGIGSLLLLAWDLSLDPAMSEATPYWIWGETGLYYGMPWTNLYGWYVTGLVLMGLLDRLDARDWLRSISPVWLAVFYGANLLVPLGMAIVAGMWGAAVATLAVLGGVWWWSSSRSSRALAPTAGEVAG